jgi:hypothetical protein
MVSGWNGAWGRPPPDVTLKVCNKRWVGRSAKKEAGQFNVMMPLGGTAFQNRHQPSQCDLKMFDM